MSRLRVVGRLKMNVDVAVARREDATVLGRVKADNGRFSLVQLERHLDLLVHFHAMWSVADAVHDMKFDDLFPSGYQEGERLICIETGRGGGFRNEALKVLKRADVCWNRFFVPARYLRPDEEWHTSLEA